MSTLAFSSALSTPTPAAAPGLLGHVGSALRVLRRVNPPLAWAGWLNLGLAGVALVLLPLDHRVVTGLPVWMKPLKFSLSIVAYAWTLGWLLADLPAAAQRAVRRISWAVAVAMAVEQLSIFVQAARGTTSHYNVGTPLDATLFGLMGGGNLGSVPGLAIPAPRLGQLRLGAATGAA